MSTEGAAHKEILECRAFGAHSVASLFPGLTAGPINCRPFGPQIENADLGKLALHMPPRLIKGSLCLMHSK
jgi:hypothetical protein